MSDKFMDFLAKLESVAPPKDRVVINQVRDLYAKQTAQMEGMGQTIKDAVSGFGRTIKDAAVGIGRDIKNTVHVMGSSNRALMCPWDEDGIGVAIVLDPMLPPESIEALKEALASAGGTPDPVLPTANIEGMSENRLKTDSSKTVITFNFPSISALLSALDMASHVSDSHDGPDDYEHGGIAIMDAPYMAESAIFIPEDRVQDVQAETGVRLESGYLDYRIECRPVECGGFALTGKIWKLYSMLAGRELGGFGN